MNDPAGHPLAVEVGVHVVGNLEGRPDRHPHNSPFPLRDAPLHLGAGARAVGEEQHPVEMRIASLHETALTELRDRA